MARGDFERLMDQERFILEVTEAFCAYMELNNISRTELAKKLGKSRGFVSQVLNGGRNLTVRTIADMAAALDTKPSFLLQGVNDFANDIEWYHDSNAHSSQMCMIVANDHVKKEINRINVVTRLTKKQNCCADGTYGAGISTFDEYPAEFAVAAGGGRG